MLQVIIENKQYRAFIKYAIAQCDYFSLVFEKDVMDKDFYRNHDIYLLLESSLLNKVNIGIHPDTGTHFEHSDIAYFKCNKSTASVLLKYESVFDWNGKFAPEELCFYRNQKAWFLSVNHEKLMFLLDVTNEEIDYLISKKLIVL